jgi:hypothetical protein
MSKSQVKANKILEQIKGENLSLPLAFARIVDRENKYIETGNGVYAAEVWALCRKYGAPMPEWVLKAVDKAAETGYLYNERGIGTGKRGDLARRFADNDRNRLFGEAHALFAKNPTLSQGQLAIELGQDKGQFSKTCAHWRKVYGPLPWAR